MEWTEEIDNYIIENFDDMGYPEIAENLGLSCLLYTSPSPRDQA